MRLGLALTTACVLLLAISDQVKTASTKQRTGAGADDLNRLPESQPPLVPLATSPEPKSTPTNRTQSTSPPTGGSTNNFRTKKSDAGWKYGGDRNEEYRKFTGVRYTPHDLAEYILRTRDEEGVALAIEELLREGLINREEAILYLESVKKELQTLKKRYEDESKRNTGASTTPNRIPQLFLQPHPVHEFQRQPIQVDDKRSESAMSPQPEAQVTAFFKQAQAHKLPEQLEHQALQTDNAREKAQANNQQQLPLQLAKLVKAKAEQEKLRQPNRTTLMSKQITSSNKTQTTLPETEQSRHESKPVYDDYLMENVIYQLAKDMFSQSMIRDNASAEQLLSRFASFLENELADKRFSKETQNKIMDTVSAALVESLRERLYLEN